MHESVKSEVTTSYTSQVSPRGERRTIDLNIHVKMDSKLPADKFTVMEKQLNELLDKFIDAVHTLAD